MNRKMIAMLAGFAAGSLAAGTALGAKLEFKDPVGDENGPGTYVYPTDAVYSPGSFDISRVIMLARSESKSGHASSIGW